MPIIDITAPESPKSPALKTPSDCSPVADVIAVHGIVESGPEAWTDRDTGILWLRDLFPFQKLNVRVLLYYYNAEAFTSPGDGSIDRLLPFAQNLVAELCADRQFADAQERPIIFICHGLGGLLVKRAVAFSSSRRSPKVEHLRSLYVSTYGILFLGTPHDGLRKDSLYILQAPESQGPNQSTLNLLKGSELLQEITDQFAPLMKRFAIYNFWGQKKSGSKEQPAYIVREDSAAPSWLDTERCGIYTTHERLTKFISKRDQGYRVVLEALTRYIMSAPITIQSRWSNDQLDIVEERRREADELLKPHLRHLSSDRPDGSLPNEWFLVPRCSSSYFTGRSSHAAVVRKQLGDPIRQHKTTRHRVFVIYGLGGAGKTQFCLKYVEDHKSRYWGIFWIDASSDDNAEADFASLGQQMGKGATFSAGLHCLSQCTEPWLLVIDNADDPELDVTKYFPVGSGGHILITTRNPSTTLHETAGHLRFSGMDPEEGVSLLLRTASSEEGSPFPDSSKRKVAQAIASELGYLALALANAGMTIRRNIYTLERYLHHYLGYRMRMISSTDIKSADEANIITTWEIPFTIIEKRKSPQYIDAVNLVHILAFLHFDSIPESIFRDSANIIKTNTCESRGLKLIRSDSIWNEESHVRVRRALSTLCDYSIIDHDPEKGIVSLHPVVQRWARERLSSEDQRYWLGAATALLARNVSPYMEASGQKFRRSLLPHIESCLRGLTLLHGPNLVRTKDRACELERFAWVFAENGLWKRARRYQQDILTFRIKALGRRHADTIQARRSLAESQWNLFDIKPLIMTQLKTLATCFFVRPAYMDWVRWPPWRPDHISYCMSMSDLTLSLWLAGKRARSKKLGERAVKGLTKRLGPDDPLTLTAKFNLARTYLHLGDHEASRQRLVEVLKKRKCLFGLEHPDTLMTRNELGMYYCAEKRHLSVAESLVRNVLASRKKLLGEEHAYTLWSVNDLAKVVHTRRRPVEAINILEPILPIVRRTLGEKHPGMSMTKANLVISYVQAQRWSEAETIIKELLQIVPEDHPDYIHTLSGYIHTRTALGDLEEAERNCTKALDMVTRETSMSKVLNMLTREKTLSLDSPRVVAVAQQLALIYKKQGRSEDLKGLQQKFPNNDLSDEQMFSIWHT